MMPHKIFYLVDFENVGAKGIEQAHFLGTHDVVHLFSTKNASKISTALLAKYNALTLVVHEVLTGSQSADMHLVSYLGYLIGKEEASASYVIVSKDTDFDAIIAFWKSERKIDVKRKKQIQGPPTVSTQRQGARFKIYGKNWNPFTRRRFKRPKVISFLHDNAPLERLRLNAEVMSALANSNLAKEDKNKVAALVVHLHNEGYRKVAIHHELVTLLGQQRATEVYRQIKALLQTPAVATTPAQL